MALAARRKLSETSLASKDILSMPSTSYRKPANADMVQRVQSLTAKNALEAGKPGAPEPANSSASLPDRPFKEIKQSIILKVSQETHKSKVYEIDLSENAIKKIENVDSFSHLRILDLACNQIEKIENLSANKELRELRLYANQISRIERLEGLKKLVILKLQQNNIEQIGDGLQQQRLLEVLRLDNNCVHTLKPSEFLPLQSLRVLNLSQNKLTEINSVCNLPKLESLDVSHNDISFLPTFKKCAGLTEVNLSFNRLESLSGLSDNNQLVHLNVSNNLLKSLRSLGQPKQHMENLYIVANLVESLEELPSVAPSLEILDISKNQVNDADKFFRVLRQLANLVELKCLQNPAFDSTSAADLRKVLPKLEVVNGINFSANKRNLMSGEPLSARPLTPGFLSSREDSTLGSSLSLSVMRPRTASKGMTLRQIETLFNSLTDTMENIERSFSRTMDKVKETLETQAPRCETGCSNQCRSCSTKPSEDDSAISCESPVPLSTSTVRSSSSMSSATTDREMSANIKKRQSSNVLTRRLEQAKNYSSKMTSNLQNSNSGNNKTVVKNKPPMVATANSNSNHGKGIVRQRQRSASRGRSIGSIGKQNSADT